MVEATSRLPRTADEAYDRILSRSPDSIKAERILYIIVAVERPLTLRAMNLALILRENYHTWPELKSDLLPEDRFRENVRDICGLFVTIINLRIYLLH